MAQLSGFMARADHAGIGSLAGTYEDFNEQYKCISGGYGATGLFCRLAKIFTMEPRDKALNPQGSQFTCKITDLSHVHGYERSYEQEKEISEVKRYYIIQGKDLRSGHENVLKFLRWYVRPSQSSAYSSMIISVYERCYENLHGRFYKGYQRALHEREAKPIIKQIAMGLKFLHEKNISHEEITLNDIVCTHRSKLEPIKLCDFNHIRHHIEDAPHLPEEQECLHGASPSKVVPTKTIRKRTIPHSLINDSLSVGFIMFELLTFSDIDDHEDDHDSEESANLLFQEPKPKHDDYRFNPDKSKLRDHSATCKDLVAGLLIQNDSQRANVDQILNHVWIIGHR